jgi:PAS domain S-box-containing protein
MIAMRFHPYEVHDIRITTSNYQSTVRATTLTVDESGVIRDCGKEVASMFGYTAGEVLDQHISILLPQLTDEEMFRSDRAFARFCHSCRIGVSFRSVTRDGSQFDSHLLVSVIGKPGMRRIRMYVNRNEYLCRIQTTGLTTRRIPASVERIPALAG